MLTEYHGMVLQNDCRMIEMVRRKSDIEHGLCSTLQEQNMLRKYLLCENE